MLLEYLTVGAYLGVLIVVGLVFSRFNRNASDYVRAGGQGTWWMVGTSILMAGISAFTFTGNGSAAYSAGPTFLVMYVANILAASLAGWFLAGWYRQTRALTQMDVVRSRFGTFVEQCGVAGNVLLQPCAAAIQLWALGVFASTAFRFPLEETVLVLGIIVVFYSTTGGKWAVMATDFVQGMVLLPITILLAILALKEVGGFERFFAFFSDPQFARDFAMVKEPGQFPEDRFTLKWIIVIFFMQLYHQVSLTTAGRYLATKDGREARRAAWLAAALLVVGSVVWFIPPMVARFLYSAEIGALPVNNPAESAYAFLSARLLPNGLMGVMIAAMFSATMSSMDTGLNEQAGIIVRNLIGRVREALQMPRLEDRRELLACKLVTLVLGSLVVSLAIALCSQRKFPLFDAYLVINSTIGLPLGLPMVAGLWIKRLPSWSYVVIFAACLAPSIYAAYDAKVNGAVWTIQDRALLIFVCGIAATLVCIPFYRFTTAEYRDRVERFFRTIRTPVDFKKEIGESRDFEQLALLGKTVLVMGCLLSLLLFLPNTWSGRACIVFVAGTTASVGMLLQRRVRIEKRRVQAGLTE